MPHLRRLQRARVSGEPRSLRACDALARLRSRCGARGCRRAPPSAMRAGDDAAYRALASASALILDGGGGVMRPPLTAAASRQSRAPRTSRRAREILDDACAAADHISATRAMRSPSPSAPYGNTAAKLPTGIADYIEAAALTGAERRQRGAAAIERIERGRRARARHRSAAQGYLGRLRYRVGSRHLADRVAPPLRRRRDVIRRPLNRPEHAKRGLCRWRTKPDINCRPN